MITTAPDTAERKSKSAKEFSARAAKEAHGPRGGFKKSATADKNAKADAKNNKIYFDYVSVSQPVYQQLEDELFELRRLRDARDARYHELMTNLQVIQDPDDDGQYVHSLGRIDNMEQEVRRRMAAAERKTKLKMKRVRVRGYFMRGSTGGRRLGTKIADHTGTGKGVLVTTSRQAEIAKAAPVLRP